MRKNIVLDTNVVLYNPEAIFSFEENMVNIPLAVVEEVDDQKRKQDEVGRNARVFSRLLDDLRGKGRLADGVKLPNGGILKVEINHQDIKDIPNYFDLTKKDNRILAVAYHLQKEDKNTILVSKDLNLRIKADVLGITAQDYEKGKINFQELYQGIEECHLSEDQFSQFFKQGQLLVEKKFPANPNQFFIMQNPANPSQSGLARYSRHYLWPLSHADSTNWGIKALNKEQKFALELLLNDDVKVVTLVGKAGTGKTLLALAVGLEKVIEKNFFTRLLITRPVIPMGQDIGYLPGSKEDKLRPWMQPIFDNLEFLSASAEQPAAVVEDLLERGIIEMEALTYIRGRSIPRQYIICDEAQNLSPHMIKTMITRIGNRSKIVFTGDLEQIDHPYLDASSSGLSYLVEKLKHEEIVGHVTLVKGERSEVAELGARLL